MKGRIVDTVSDKSKNAHQKRTGKMQNAAVGAAVVAGAAVADGVGGVANGISFATGAVAALAAAPVVAGMAAIGGACVGIKKFIDWLDD